MKESMNSVTTNTNIDIDTDLDTEEKAEEAEIREEEIAALKGLLIDINNDINETQQTIDNTLNGAALRKAQEEITTLRKLRRSVKISLSEEKSSKAKGNTEGMPYILQKTGIDNSDSQSVGMDESDNDKDKIAEQEIRELQQLSREIEWTETNNNDSQSVTMNSTRDKDGKSYNTDDIN